MEQNNQGAFNPEFGNKQHEQQPESKPETIAAETTESEKQVASEDQAFFELEEPTLKEEKEEKTETAVEEKPSYPYKDKPSVARETEDWSKPVYEDHGDPEIQFDIDFKLPSRIYEKERQDIEHPERVYKDTQSEGWQKAKIMATDTYIRNGLYQSRFFEEGSDFSQGVDLGNGKTAAIGPLKFKETEGEIKGELAILKIAKMIGSGEVVNVPLPHSGIWVTIKPPAESDLIDFYNTVIRDKVVLGRATMGLTLTNYSVFSNSRLFDFIMRYVHSVNYEDIPVSELKNKININDFPVLVWGIACAIYPNGFQYQRACCASPNTCNHVVKETLNLSKLLWTDNSAMTAVQKNILSENRPGKLKQESHRKYLAENIRGLTRLVSINENIRVNLKTPTFAEYTTDGLAWINKINDAIDDAATITELDEEGKKDLLIQRVKASALAQFAHFVDYIEVGDNTVTNRETIIGVLESFSTNDEIRKKLQGAIFKYKEDSMFAMVGIPSFKCPSCGVDQNQDTTGKFPDVIPLDAVSLFFLGLSSKIKMITMRDV